MLVDDSDFARKVLKEILEKAGFFAIIEAKNGKEALALFEEEKPDIMLLDLIMPDIGGLDVLDELKLRGASVKVIVVTSVGGPVIQNEIRESFSGVAAYVNKPFDEKDIVNTVKRVCSILQ